MAETTVADRWIHGVLSADATLTGLVGTRIYRGKAPKDTAYPFVVFMLQQGTGADVRGTGTLNILTAGDWIIKAVDRNPSPAGCATISARIYTLLHAQKGTVTSGAVLICTREEPLAYVEEADGVIYQHLGGLYQILIQ